MGRERRSSPSSKRMEKFLGFTSTSQLALTKSSDLNELQEDDVWGEELQITESRKEEFKSGKENSTSSYRRWLGMERETGFSGRVRGLSSLSPLNRGSGTLSVHGTTREETPGRQYSASRMITQIGNAASYGRHVSPQSAPVKVPDWSKIVDLNVKARADDSYGVDDDKDGEILPPHELLAREYARSQMTTFSVFEGAGRTLKGRDLSRVRNAVWRQTGFLE